MAVDPNKMAQWAGGDAGQPPKGKPGKGSPPVDEEPDEELDGEEEQEEEETGEGNGALLAALEQHVDAVQECCDELDPAMLESPEEELDPQDRQILQEGFDALPEDLKQAIQKGGELSMDDAMAAADHLHEEDLIDNPDVVAGWLYRVSQLGSANAAEEEPSGEPSEDSGNDSDSDYA